MGFLYSDDRTTSGGARANLDFIGFSFSTHFSDSVGRNQGSGLQAQLESLFADKDQFIPVVHQSAQLLPKNLPDPSPDIIRPNANWNSCVES
jgi:hypothetical protein